MRPVDAVLGLAQVVCREAAVMVWAGPDFQSTVGAERFDPHYQRRLADPGDDLNEK